MKFKITRGLLIKISLAIALSLLVVFLFIYHDTIYDIAYPFVLSILIAYLLNPIVCKMEQKGIKRIAGILIIYGILAVFVTFICIYIIPVIVRDLSKLTGTVPQYNARFNSIKQYIQSKYKDSGIPEGIKNAIDNNIKKIEKYITIYLEEATSLILLYISKAFSFALIPVLSYYFLKDFRIMTRDVKMLIPRKYRNQIVRICSNIDDVFGNYVRSQIILSAFIAILTSAALLIIKIDFALILGLINGITNIIPYFGPIIGAVPAVLIALLQSPEKALYTIIIIIIIQQFESDIISPKITAGIVGLHPITVIFALIIGGKFFGIMGMVLGVPAAAAIKVIYKDVMKNMF